jgi:hypothetical protein
VWRPWPGCGVGLQRCLRKAGGGSGLQMSDRQFWMVVTVALLVLIVVGWWQVVRFHP